MRIKISEVVMLAVLTLFAVQGDVFSDSLPLGGRTGAMGGAGSAFCRDSAAPYINPAGVILLSGSIFSLSTSLYTQTGYQVNDFFIPGDIDTGNSVMGPANQYEQQYLTSSNFTGFPGALSYFLHLADNQIISFSAIVPTYERINFNGSITIKFPNAVPSPVTMDTAETFIVERTEYYFGPSYSMGLGNLRIGASAFALYRTILNSVESTSFNTVGTTYFNDARTTGYGEGSTWGLTSVLGIQYHLPVFDAGVSFTLPTVNLQGAYSNSGKFTLSNPDNLGVADEVQITRGDGKIGYHKPARIRAGIGYENPAAWSIAVDVEYVFGTDRLISRDVTYKTTTYIQGGGVTQYTEKDTSDSGSVSAVNLFLGGEYYINSSQCVRLGAFYMPSTVEELDVTSNIDVLTMKIDRIGGTIGFANFTEMGETSIGLSYTYGIGNTVAGDVYSNFTSSSYKKVDVNFYQIALFFSGDVDFTQPVK